MAEEQGEQEADRRRLEEAGLNAWPALQQMLVDGWVVRFAGGFTKRANAVTPLYPTSLDVADKILLCEQLYRDRGLRPIFRLLSFAHPARLDEALTRRGYARHAPSLVLHRALADEPLPPASLIMREEAVDDWLPLFGRLTGSPPAALPPHRAILEAVAARRVLCSLSEGVEAVACGMGVLEGTLFGLFDLATAPARRNQGLGTRLVGEMLHWAQQRGATRAYLQVMISNAPARHLYTKLGFREAYQYWYRVAPPDTLSPGGLPQPS